MAVSITEMGNVTQGQGVPDHQVLPIGGAQHFEALCCCVCFFFGFPVVVVGQGAENYLSLTIVGSRPTAEATLCLTLVLHIPFGSTFIFQCTIFESSWFDRGAYFARPHSQSLHH